MHDENRTEIPHPMARSIPVFSLLVSISVPEHGLDPGGAMQPLTNSEFGSIIGWARASSSGPYIVLGLNWPALLHSVAAFLSTARKWPRDGAFWPGISASVVLLGHKEKHHILDLLFLLLLVFFSLEGSLFLPLIDLLESSRMLLTPIRLPSVMLLSWKKDPVDYNIPTKSHLGLKDWANNFFCLIEY